VAALLSLLKEDDDAQVRRRVIEALGEIGPAAAAAVEALREALRDDDSAAVRRAAAEALKKIERK
jgi:HEAT repeat protein